MSQPLDHLAKGGQSELRLGTVNHFARYMGVNPRTVRNWIARGYFPVYRKRGISGVVIDIDEAETVIRALPPTVVKLHYGTFGEKADVRTLDGVR